MTSQTVIQVRDVRRSFRSPKKEEGWKGTLGLLVSPKYESHEALKGVTFNIESGSFVGLIGANGAGKTTLLKILSGLIPPSSGDAQVLGFEPFKRPIEFRQSISLVMGQKAQLWWDLPAVDAFDLIRAIYEIPTKTYRDRLGILTDLMDVKKHLNTQIRRLSLGERMKMELIGALLHWPQVIFLDEPTIGLDVLAAHKLREFLRVFNQQEKATIILTSHNMDDIERLCSRILILRSGEMIYDGPPGKLTREGELMLRVRLMQTPTSEELQAVTGLSAKSIDLKTGESAGEENEDGSDLKSIYFHVKQDQVASSLQKLMSKYQVVDMGMEEQSLEKVIQRLYEDERG
ncbi:ATP-binding cassette domain-containing protein [bacterium]|nr:ATP-binding cassette domain-containing protein [bacterium]